MSDPTTAPAFGALHAERNCGPTRRAVLGSAAAVPVLAAARASWAQSNKPIRIGVLADLNGPYVDSSGPGSVLAARLAVADAGGQVLGSPVEILAGDSLNKPDAASIVARQWFDAEGVDAVLDLPVTPVAAAVQQVAKEKGRTVMIAGAAVTDFTNRLCSPLSTHWADDSHALTTAVARDMVARGGRTWFFITVDFSFGRSIEAEASAVIRAQGGKVIESAYFPIGSSDFSAQLTQARTSGAEVIGIAAVGNDQVNLIKQASEFGVGVQSDQKLAAFLVYITDIHALGLAVTQDLVLASGFYWDQTETSRAFAKRFYAARKAMPTKEQALCYVATRHYLNAMRQAGTRDPLAVNRAMREMEVDYMGHPGRMRSDGRFLYDVTLYRVKKPSESQAAWDYYAPLSTIPADQAFLPPAANCG